MTHESRALLQVYLSETKVGIRGADAFPGRAAGHACTVEGVADAPGWNFVCGYANAGCEMVITVLGGDASKWSYRVGCHTDDTSAHNEWKRWPRVSTEGPLVPYLFDPLLVQAPELEPTKVRIDLRGVSGEQHLSHNFEDRRLLNGKRRRWCDVKRVGTRATLAILESAPTPRRYGPAPRTEFVWGHETEKRQHWDRGRWEVTQRPAGQAYVPAVPWGEQRLIPYRIKQRQHAFEEGDGQRAERAPKRLDLT